MGKKRRLEGGRVHKVLKKGSPLLLGVLGAVLDHKTSMHLSQVRRQEVAVNVGVLLLVLVSIRSQGT